MYAHLHIKLSFIELKFVFISSLYLFNKKYPEAVGRDHTNHEVKA